MANANLFVESRQGSSVLEFLEILLGSSTATLTLGNDLDSTLVDSGCQVHLHDLGADGTRKLQEEKGSAGLDDNGLETIVEHVRGHQLELLRSNQLDGLAQPEAKACHRSQSLFKRANASGR
jgi:hypothetical protein